MDNDPYTTRSEQAGCDVCGKKGVIFYAIEYYCLPSKFVRKRHRDKSRLAICCRDCFEADPALPVRLGDGSIAIAKNPGNAPRNVADFTCAGCGNKLNLGALYGVITKTLFMDGSIIESALLGRFCSNCVEQKEVVLFLRSG